MKLLNLLTEKSSRNTLPDTGPAKVPVRDLDSFDEFLKAFDDQENFTYTKINHGFWEILADVYARLGEPVPSRKWAEADKIAGRSALFTTGFVPQLLDLLVEAGNADDPALHIGLELSAWPDDDRIIGTPFHPQRSEPILARYLGLFSRLSDGLLLKKAIMGGRIGEFFTRLEDRPVLIVGPDYIEPLRRIPALKSAHMIAIHAEKARLARDETELEISAWLSSKEGAVVLLQAGTMAPYLVLRLRKQHPGTRWVDGGLAFSIGEPDDLLKRNWGKVYYRQIVRSYNQLIPGASLPEDPRLDYVESAFNESLADYPDLQPVESEGKISFVERKSLDVARVAHFTVGADRFNRWANRGPAWYALGRAYERHFAKLSGKRVIPCANGGMALEALASLHALRAGKQLRWCVSAFGFANTGRGMLADAIRVDCDEKGVLSLASLKALDRESFDGVIVTNPFGLVQDFSGFEAWAKQTGKALLIDNAAGISPNIPDVAYQSFSLHHTKPYGFGEGGLAAVPEEDAETFLRLFEYTPLEAGEEPYWVNNGKLSEPSCACHLARLESQPEWAPLYQMQSVRIGVIAASVGLVPLLTGDVPVMSQPFLAPHPVPASALANDRFVLGKYYKPLASAPRVDSIFERLINVPCHPDMRHIERAEIESVLMSVLNRAADR